MTIEMLNRGTILVTMETSDMQRYALSFEEDASPEEGLRELLETIGEECGFDRRGRSYLVEALPSRDGCLLIITVRKIRRVYRIKRECARMLCVFDTADQFLDWYVKGIAGGAVYRMDDRYVLIPPVNASKQMLALLSEYGRLMKANAAAAARIREFGVPILPNRKSM